MKGLSVLIYTILLLILYFIENAAFLSIAGAVQGVPAKVWAVADHVYEDLTRGESVTMPKGMQTFILDCAFPNDSRFHEDPERGNHDYEAASEGCTYDQNTSVSYPGVVCIFYDYHDYRYRSCKGLLYTPVRTYYNSGDTSPIYVVARDEEAGTLELGEPVEVPDIPAVT